MCLAEILPKSMLATYLDHFTVIEDPRSEVTCVDSLSEDAKIFSTAESRFDFVVPGKISRQVTERGNVIFVDHGRNCRVSAKNRALEIVPKHRLAFAISQPTGPFSKSMQINIWTDAEERVLFTLAERDPYWSKVTLVTAYTGPAGEALLLVQFSLTTEEGGFELFSSANDFSSSIQKQYGEGIGRYTSFEVVEGRVEKGRRAALADVRNFSLQTLPRRGSHERMAIEETKDGEKIKIAEFSYNSYQTPRVSQLPGGYLHVSSTWGFVLDIGQGTALAATASAEEAQDKILEDALDALFA
jgi:hypothetical protein